MLKKQKQLSFLKKKIKKWIKEKQEIIDILMFGSFMRNKSMPRDIDLCILLNDDDEKKAIDLTHSLAKLFEKQTELNLQINSITEKDFILGSSLTKTLIEEGFSFLKNRLLSELMGYKSYILFFYSLKKFSHSQRVRFHYALQGRNKEKGILNEVHGVLLGGGVIKVPVIYEDLFKEFLDKWDVVYKTDRILS